MNKDYLDKIFNVILKQDNPYSGGNILPFSTGEYFIYHFRNKSGIWYEITLPKRFKIELHYHKDKIQLNKYSATEFYYINYYDIECPVRLADYFECVEYNNMIIPVALNKKGIESKVAQALKLKAFL